VVLVAGGASGTTPLAGAQVFGSPGTPAQHLRGAGEDSSNGSASGVDTANAGSPKSGSGSSTGWYVAGGVLALLAAAAAVLLALRGRGGTTPNTSS